MKPLPFLTVYFLSSLAVLAQVKVASVNMSDLFNKNPETRAYGAETTAQKKLIEEDQRAQAVAEKMREIQEMDKTGKQLVAEFQKQPPANQNQQESENIRELLDKRKIAEQEFQSLEQEFFEFKNDQLKMINKAMAKRMRVILNETTATVVQYAAAQGYDIVYDMSGYTNTGLAAIVYAKPGLMTDITPEIMKMIVAKNTAVPTPIDKLGTPSPPKP